MTKAEFLKSKEFEICKKKILNYPAGFKFTIPYYKMNNGQKNAMRIVTEVLSDYIDCVEIALDIECNCTEETYIRKGVH